jgi:hypothetical protein
MPAPTTAPRTGPPRVGAERAALCAYASQRWDFDAALAASPCPSVTQIANARPTAKALVRALGKFSFANVVPSKKGPAGLSIEYIRLSPRPFNCNARPKKGRRRKMRPIWLRRKLACDVEPLVIRAAQVSMARWSRSAPRGRRRRL